MVEAFGRWEKLKPDRLADRGDRGFVTTQEVPSGDIDTLGRGIHAHAVGCVDLPVEADRDDRDRVFTERLVSNFEIPFDVGRDYWANVMTTRVDKADDERLAAQRLQLELLARDITKCVIADGLTDNTLTDCQGGFAIVRPLGGKRRCHPDKDDSAECACNTQYRAFNG